MAINKNHEFEDLDGVKCAIVEKNVSPERVAFLKKLLEYNRYTVVVVKSPPPKAATPPPAVPSDPAAVAATAIATVDMPTPEPPATFTIGVTDVVFNSTNAIMGRLLKTPDGHVVTLAYWNQKEKESHDEIPYFEKS
jgi:hypothetical protein